MALSLGIDTGGTYTDAVLYDPALGVIAAAKALTTRHDLSVGVSAAIAGVLAKAEPSRIRLVSLSTTLATNALVEGQGSPAALLLLGYDGGALGRSGLGAALKGDPVAFIGGGHGALGDEQQPLDHDALRRAIQDFAPRVSAFAVAGYFGVRNPSHELAARDLIRELTRHPVTCAHELSHHLDAPRRALTALFNARLISLLDRLIQAVERQLRELAIEAPLMVVKGDGALIAAADALTRPVETILSGPAASVVGAMALTQERDVVVSDMGGTTTDIAFLKDGRPVLNHDGATVGGWRTMVEAIAVYTFGLGGDSEVHVDPERGLLVGPRRVIPLSLLAHQYPESLAILRRQTHETLVGALHGRFALRTRSLGSDEASLSGAERRMWEAIDKTPTPLAELLGGRGPERPLRRLIERGLVQIAAFTPSDAAHILGLHTSWSVEAARLGAELWRRRPGERGWIGGFAVEAFATAVIDRVAAQTCEALIASTVEASGGPPVRRTEPLGTVLIDLASSKKADPNALYRVSIELARPLVAIGAPILTYYPQVAQRLGTRLVVPEHHDVTNAVGAVAGGVFETVLITISALREDRFRVHGPRHVTDFGTLAEAAAHAIEEARDAARARALAAGAETVEITVERKDTVVRNFGQDLFIESSILATAAGRPRLA
ncbi:MAG TPA: hydantoinase/oxoprolinase family protein [Alphaproteobacteria bacterium]|nr:hydantoinase/oxoprolinase family protein [Alphaproteobacteria bacterium]